MNINVLDKFVSRFSATIHINQLKLSDLTDKKAVRLNDKEMLKTDEASPNKFETETIRFWRIKKLLPFFEEKKHARISLAQLMWLRFLSELRKVSPSTLIMEKAHDFFIKRAYEQRLGYTNLFEREKAYRNIINPTQEQKEILVAYQSLINDKLLMYSLDRDINFFNMGILDYVVNDEDVNFVYYYKIVTDPDDGVEKELVEFDIVKKGKVEREINGEKVWIEFPFYDRPHVIIPASYIVRDTFYDCNLCPKAFNILALEKSERKIFELIKNLKVSELSFILNEDSNSAPLIYKFVNNIEDNINPIKESKLIMGTKKYLYGIVKLTNEKIEYFNPNPNSDLNKNN
jgi:uncharacterized protein YktA (UPF0223 family)